MSSQTNPTIDHDTRWKELITALFDDFVNFFLPTDFVKKIDRSKKVVFLNQELHSVLGEFHKKGRVIQDLLAKMWLKNGKEHWILIHVEVQGSYEKGFTKRMFTYFYRLFDKYKKPITAVVVYTSKSIPKSHDRYIYEFGGTELVYKFNNYLIKDAKENELIESKNPFALAVLAAKYLNDANKNSQKLYLFKLKLFELATLKGYSHQQITELIRFIFLLLRLPKKKQMAFEKIVRKTLNIDVMNTFPVNKQDQEAFERFAKVIWKSTIGLPYPKTATEIAQEWHEKEEEIAKKEEEIAKVKKEATKVKKEATKVKKEAIIAKREATKVKKEAAEKEEKVIKGLLKKGDYSIKEIAEITGASLYKIRKIKKQL